MDTTRPLDPGTELDPPEASPSDEAVRKIDCSTRDVTWSTNADVATAGLTAGAETAEERDVVGHRELTTVVARELEVGVELVVVAMVNTFHEENTELLLTGRRGRNCDPQFQSSCLCYRAPSARAQCTAHAPWP